VARGFKLPSGGSPVACEANTFSAVVRKSDTAGVGECSACQCPALPNMQFAEQFLPKSQEEGPCPVPRARMASCRANIGPVCSTMPNFCGGCASA
jgi:hypothetical protein